MATLDREVSRDQPATLDCKGRPELLEIEVCRGTLA